MPVTNCITAIVGEQAKDLSLCTGGIGRRLPCSEGGSAKLTRSSILNAEHQKIPISGVKGEGYIKQSLGNR